MALTGALGATGLAPTAAMASGAVRGHAAETGIRAAAPRAATTAAPAAAGRHASHGQRSGRAAPAPKDPTVVYDENFENNPQPGPIRLDTYTGASGETYTADPNYLTDCNGAVMSYNNRGPYPAECGSQTPWDTLGDIGRAFGEYNGETPEAAKDNHEVAGWTLNGTSYKPTDVQFETKQPIPLASTNRFLTASVMNGGVCYSSTYVDPKLNFFLTDGGTEYPLNSTPSDACTAPNAKEYSYPDAQATIKVANVAANQPQLYKGSSFGLKMENAAATSSGNDGAFDDIKVLDVTPTVTKSFDPSPAPVGGTSTLTFTVTNTTDLLAKKGWSFTDDLPTGLKVADPAGTSTTCTNGQVDASAGGSSVDLKGDLEAGQSSCTLSVKVTSDTAGTYTNCPDSGSNLVGVIWTDCADVEFDTPKYTITKTASPASGSNVKPGDTVKYTVKVDNTGTVPVDATASDDLSQVLDDAAYDNDAKASSGSVSYSSPTLSWKGTLAAGNSATITYSVKVDDPDTGDGKLDNHVTGNSYSNCTTGNEPECTTDENVRSLKISKTSDAKNPVKAGDTIQYTVKVHNPGPTDYTGAAVSDDLTRDLDDATYNNDATASSGTASYARPTVSWSGDVPAGSTVTITYSITVDNPDKGDHELANTAVGPEDSNCAKGSTDASCSTDDKVAEPKVTKSSTARRNPVRPGSKVTYTVTIENVGKADYPNASMSDDLSNLLDDARYDNDAKASSGTVSYAEPTLSWKGDVPAGGTVIVTFSVRVNKPDTGDTKLDNTVVVPGGSNCETASSDPSCSTDDPVADLTVTKSSDAKAPVKPGDTITYTVTVANTGSTDYPNAFITDDLSKELDDAAYNGDATASSGTVAYAEPNLRWHGAVPAGQTVTITYSVTVDNPDTGDHQLANTVVGPANSDCGPRSSDPECSTSDDIADLHIHKTSDAKDPVKAGDTVHYTVTVKNTGTADYPGAKVSDDLSGDLDDAAYNGDAKASSGSATYAAPKLNWRGDVKAGQTVTITYSITVNNPDKGDHELANAVVGPDGSNCPPAAARLRAATDPGCRTHDKVAELKITKTASTAHPKPGEKVTYTVTVTNVGTAAYPGATFTDDLSRVLDDAHYDQDATATAGTVSYRQPKLTWTGNLAAGQQATVTYTVTVDNPDNGDGHLDNAVTGSGGSNCAPGSHDPDCSTHGVVPGAPVKPTRPSGPLAHTGLGLTTWYTAMGAALLLALGVLAFTVARRRR
ncbi:hypothetical protein BIV57_01140 [Mangrovactinospora gilvigrisea]|uniref:DUF11 domain-containing protein n=1 Tax=Mangrovactinospora gilvigrisea TaxID=1428644 RepID=A0A1J7CD28_9ACTN|nr:DUF11 domain-containing protein [Mangrovactinospora gilvigrisea]OIV39468.1 hypothetical protein BIV57_01140 [Mangrovactinospora gilvigrisea]